MRLSRFVSIAKNESGQRFDTSTCELLGCVACSGITGGAYLVDMSYTAIASSRESRNDSDFYMIEIAS